MAVPESNGGLALEPGDVWPAEADPGINSSPLDVGQMSGAGTPEQEEGGGGGVGGTAWERPEDVQPAKDSHNCEGLSPENHLGDADPDPDPETANTVFIAPLDGSQAELRSRVIKEVRKPGRSK